MQFVSVANANCPSPRFLGLDLAKREVQLSVLNSAGEEFTKCRFASTTDNFLQLSSELTPTDTVALEVTTNAFTIARILSKSGARIILSNPIKTRIIAEAKIKTDKIDARVLAELARVNYLPSVWLPDAETEALRQLFSDRRSLVDRRTQLKNQIHAVLHRNLITVEYSDLFGEGGRAWLNQLLKEAEDEASSRCNALDRLRLKTLLAELDHMEEAVADSDAIIASFIATRPTLRASLDRLLSIPGVSLVVGAGLLAAIGDIKRFTSGKKLAAYFGLVPSTYQTGSMQARNGRITKSGRAQARWLAVEAAEHLRKAPGPLRALYTRIQKKRGHNVAVVAVGRKLAELIWQLLTKEEDYLYAMPRLTDEKRARVRQLAKRKVGVKTTSAARGRRGGQGGLYGTGVEGRVVKTEIARRAAEEAEEVYKAIVGSKEQQEETRAREGEEEGFNPTKPMVVDWQKVLERVAEKVVAKRTRKKAKEERVVEA
jgi:transposase